MHLLSRREFGAFLCFRRHGEAFLAVAFLYVSLHSGYKWLGSMSEDISKTQLRFVSQYSTTNCSCNTTYEL